MTYRGPFQPLLFCDSVISPEIPTGIHLWQHIDEKSRAACTTLGTRTAYGRQRGFSRESAISSLSSM